MSEETIVNQEVTEAPAEEVKSEAVESPAATNESVDFHSMLSEEYRDASNIKDFKSADDLAKSYIELQRMVGNSVRIPSEDASDEAKQEFIDKIKDIEGILVKDDENLYNKLGRPEDAEGYKFELSEDIAAAIEPELADFKTIAHEAGLTNEQAQALVDMRLKTVEAQQEQMNANREAAESELKKIWGADFDNRLNAAKQVLTVMREKYGDAVTDLVNGPAGNNVAFLNMASELAAMYKEQNHTGMSGANFGMTPEMALGKIQEKRGDSGFMGAYTDVHHPEHKKAVVEMQRLYQIANGEKV